MLLSSLCISFALLVGYTGLVNCLNDTEYYKKFQDFIEYHNKLYTFKDGEQKAYQAFVDHLKYIDEHNALQREGEFTFTVGINPFSDMTLQEFVFRSNGLKGAEKSSKDRHEVFFPAQDAAPESVDWRKTGAVTTVGYQGVCASCWAFSSTGALEGQRFVKTRHFVMLSEQNLIDCSNAFGNSGCEGGLMENAFKYVESNKGIDTEDSYPYEGYDQNCKFNSSTVGATAYGYAFVKKYDEEQLKRAVAQAGPISVGIDASHLSFMNYKSGIYFEKNCNPDRLDHAVLVVGYGVYKGLDYWLVKNSWGYEWGEDGYIRMSRNRDNNCGIATHALYPIV